MSNLADQNRHQWALMNGKGYVIAVCRTRTECADFARAFWAKPTTWKAIKRRHGWHIARCTIIIDDERKS